MYKAVLRNELLGTRIDGLHQNGTSNGGGLFSSGGSGTNGSPAANGFNISTNGTNGSNQIPTNGNNLVGTNLNMQTTGANVC